MNTIWVAFGSNQQDPVGQLLKARCSLREVFAETGASRLYRSAPWGYTEQPAFINAVVSYQTRQDARSVLALLQQTEQAQGRKRPFKYAPRTLDLDLLLYEKQQINTPELTLPHPGIAERVFVLAPLADIDPGLEIIGVGCVAQRLAALEQAGIRAIYHPDWYSYPRVNHEKTG